MVKDKSLSSMRTFLVVWSGQLISLIGSSITGFAMSVWAYQTTGSVTRFALILFCTTLPGVLLSPIAGALVDRWNHRTTMALSDTGSALTTLALGVLLLLGKLEIWHIYIATAINSSLSAFQWPAYTAATTLLVPGHQLGRASGMVQMSRAAAQLIAPMLGAVLLGAIGLRGVILLDLVTFLFAIFTLMLVRFPTIKLSCEVSPATRSLVRDILFGWRYVSSKPGILGLLVFFAASNFLGGTLQVLVTPLVLSFTTTVTLGIVMSTGGIGMLIGSLVMSVWGGPSHLMKAVFGLMLICGICTFTAGLQASVLLIACSAFVFFFCVPIINGCSQVILQRKVAPALQGRVFALEGAIGSASLPLAYVIAGPLADHVFEPFMISDSPIANSFGHIIGTGPGRGIALLFIVTGALTIVLTLLARRYPRLRCIESELPDNIPDEGVNDKKSGDISAQEA
ncbi:MAG: MFS transporter [Candidatus Thiodiazotropha sp.]